MSAGLLERTLLALWLAVVWTALWGTVSIGTFVAGGLVGALVTLGLRSEIPGRPHHFHPLATVRFAGAFVVMLAMATWDVAAAVLQPASRVAPAVVRVTLQERSPAVVTVVANSITLTPGTITLDAVPVSGETFELLVHALDASDPEAVRRDVLRLHRLAAAAFGAPVDPARRAEA